MTTSEERVGPLADVRVIDLSAVLAGPGIARHLADFGADVIKVERAGTGDTARNLGWRDDDGETHFSRWPTATNGSSNST